MDALAEALRRAPKWLKSSVERPSGKYLDGLDRVFLGSAKDRKVRYFAPLGRLAGPRNGVYSEFPDSLWKGYSPNFGSRIVHRPSLRAARMAPKRQVGLLIGCAAGYDEGKAASSKEGVR